MSMLKWIKSPLTSDHITRVWNSSIRGGGLARICFHESEVSNLHVMLIAIPEGQTYPYHKHLDSDELYFCLKGVLVVNTLANNQSQLHTVEPTNPLESTNLERESGMVLKSGVWHSTVGGVGGAVFLEVRRGPFDRSNTVFLRSDSINGDWQHNSS